MTVLNLPRKVRYLQENVLLLGVIPGPHEPKSMNSFLYPLVNELCNLWKGVMLKTVPGTGVVVRAALLCVACDIPAARKVCGFVGHNGLHGCSKCLCEFPTTTFGEKPDYSNYNRSTWKVRNPIEHKEQAAHHKNCNTKSEQKHIEKKYGLRYSSLLALPYFDASRMCIIDPMHNLFLGTAKRFINIWKAHNILTPQDFIVLQEKVDSIVAPNDIGRTPSKIASSFSGFTAEQFKNWTMYFSLLSLKGILPWRHYNCWHLFVRICYLLCRRSITHAQLDEADTLILQFCHNFVALYSKESCTPNIHLHNHLVCIGPVYAFWFFHMKGSMVSWVHITQIVGAYLLNWLVAFLTLKILLLSIGQ